MGLRGFLKAATEAKLAAAEAARLEGQTAKLEGEIKKLQFMNVQLATKILIAGEQERAGYKGNEYQSYAKAVEEIDKKYRGTAAWGCGQAGTIIDLRAAFIMSEGIQIQPKKRGEGQAELDFANGVLDFNDLDEEMAQEYAKEAEIEGKILLKLDWVEGKNTVQTRFVPWTSKKYEIKTDPSDYSKYVNASWHEKNDDVKLEPADFVYKKFGGRVNDPNDAAPKIMKCLNEIDALAKALRDLRTINNVFAAPVPTFEFANDPEAAESNQKKLDEMNWKIQKALSTSGVFKYVQPTMQGCEVLLKEVETNGMIISGCTGVPVHFLGFVHLLANRSTGENLGDLIYASTLKERVTWIGAYEELFSKGMAIANRKTGNDQKSTKLDPSKIRVTIPFISQKTWEAIEKIYLPAALAGKISTKLFLTRIPGVNVDEELENQRGESNVQAPEGIDHDLEEEEEGEE